MPSLSVCMRMAWLTAFHLCNRQTEERKSFLMGLVDVFGDFSGPERNLTLFLIIGFLPDDTTKLAKNFGSTLFLSIYSLR